MLLLSTVACCPFCSKCILVVIFFIVIVFFVVIVVAIISIAATFVVAVELWQKQNRNTADIFYSYVFTAFLLLFYVPRSVKKRENKKFVFRKEVKKTTVTITRGLIIGKWLIWNYVYTFELEHFIVFKLAPKKSIFILSIIRWNFYLNDW